MFECLHCDVFTLQSFIQSNNMHRGHLVTCRIYPSVLSVLNAPNHNAHPFLCDEMLKIHSNLTNILI